MGLPTPTNNWIGLAPGQYTAIIKQTLQAYFALGIGNFGWSIGQQTFNGALGTTAGSGGAFIPSPQFAALGAGGWHWHAAGPVASLSSATKIGGLSVPSSWLNGPGAPVTAGEQAATKLVSANFAWFAGWPQCGPNDALMNPAWWEAAARNARATWACGTDSDIACSPDHRRQDEANLGSESGQQMNSGYPVIEYSAASRCCDQDRINVNSNQSRRCEPEGYRGGNGMSFVTTQPEALAAAAGTLQGIGAAMSSQNAAAAAPTTGVVPAAADEVSALTAAQFAAHAQMYQAVSAQAAAIHELFVHTLGMSSGSYAATEAANAASAG